MSARGVAGRAGGTDRRDTQGEGGQSMPDRNHPDLGAVFDAHVRHEFEDRDVDATMRTMTADPYVYHVPTMTDGVRAFYAAHFIGKWPKDTAMTRVSRTVGADQVVDELVVTFTHDVVMDIFLPGIPPTGRRVVLPHVVVMKFQDGKVAHEHIYWDQASLLAQVGLLNPASLPVVGAEQAEGVVDRVSSLNALIDRAGRASFGR